MCLIWDADFDDSDDYMDDDAAGNHDANYDYDDDHGEYGYADDHFNDNGCRDASSTAQYTMSGALVHEDADVNAADNQVNTAPEVPI